MKLLFLGTGAAGGVTGHPLDDPNIRRCSSTLVDRDLLLDPGPHIFDFAERCAGDTLNKRTVESLIKAGAFDGMPHNRNQLLHI